MKKKTTKLLIMLTKYSLLGCLSQILIFNLLFAFDANSQRVESVYDVNIRINLSDVTMEEAFKKIESKTNFVFTFDKKDLNQDVKLNWRSNNSSVSELLKYLSKASKLTFKQINHNIYVKRDDKRRGKEIEVLIQTRNITGKVTSYEDEEGLPGVNVLEKGTNNGTVTNVQGTYSLEVNEGATLVFSSVGYTSEEVEIGNRSVIDLTMTQDIQQLQELVVVGYGTNKARDLTGSVESIKPEDIASVNVPNFDAALQGRAAGVQVTSAAGTPGAVNRVMIRGTNSISQSTEPLWVIDGMIVGSSIDNIADGQGGANGISPLSLINPNDIQSIEVLKDAAATAIYGNRGSNGVIIVTTKSGKSGAKAMNNISISTGITDLTRHPDEIGFAGTQEWFNMVETARTNSSLTPTEFDPTALNAVGAQPGSSATLSRSQALATEIDWLDQILQTGSFVDVNASTSKGFGENGSYYVSGNYRNDQGVMKFTDMERFVGRTNVNFEIFDGLRSEVRFNIAYINSNRRMTDGNGEPCCNNNIARGGFAQAASETYSWLPIYDPNVSGEQEYFDPLSGNNHVASLDPENFRDNNRQFRILSGLALEYAIPGIEDLSVRGEFSMDIQQSHNVLWANTVIREESAYAFDDDRNQRNLLYNLYASYNKNFGIHDINVVLGMESQEETGRRTFLEGQGLNGTAQEIGGPSQPLRIGSFWGGEIYRRGYFGRINYKLRDRYLLSASFRRDGTSVFTEENRWASFPALSAGWIMSEETFLQGIPAISFLKIRASYGQTGNAQTPVGITMDGYAGWGRYGSRADGVGAGDLLSNIGVPEVTWETTVGTDVGLEFGLFDDRISGNVSYYQQNVQDLLVQVPIPQSSGGFRAQSIWANVGDLNNSGVEFSLNAVAVSTNNFRWSINGNITTNRNRIDQLHPILDNGGDGINDGYGVTRTGGRLGAFFVPDYAGVHPEYGYEMIYQADRDRFLTDENGNQVLNADGTPALNPNYLQRYVDPTTGENVMIPATRNNLRDHRIIQKDKTGLPTYFGGIENRFEVSNFDFSFLFTFSGGNYIYDLYEENTIRVGSGGTLLRSDMITNNWQNPGDNALYPRLVWNQRYDVYDENGDLASSNERFDGGGSARPNGRFLYKGDFVRLRTVSLGYNLPDNLTQRLNIGKTRIFIAANNLLTLTPDFEGLDPEGVNLNGSAQARNLSQGVLGVQLPTLKTYFVGLNLSF